MQKPNRNRKETLTLVSQMATQAKLIRKKRIAVKRTMLETHQVATLQKVERLSNKFQKLCRNPHQKLQL